MRIYFGIILVLFVGKIKYVSETVCVRQKQLSCQRREMRKIVVVWKIVASRLFDSRPDDVNAMEANGHASQRGRAGQT